MADTKPQHSPPGRQKIIGALRRLMETKSFNAITTAEIARTAKVTEGLIYKYFSNKRDLLYQVLSDHFERFIIQCDKDMQKAESAADKLRSVILSSLRSYDRYRVFARILLLEVRNSPDYFQSNAYRLVKLHGRIILNIIEEGVAAGQLRGDIEPAAMRATIFGAIEHNALTAILFNRAMAPETITDELCRILFAGIRVRPDDSS